MYIFSYTYILKNCAKEGKASIRMYVRVDRGVPISEYLNKVLREAIRIWCNSRRGLRTSIFLMFANGTVNH